MRTLDLGRLATIARSELSRGAGFFDKSTTVVLAVTTALLLLVGPIALQGGMDFDHELYRVHVDEDSPVAPVVDAEPRFRRVSVEDPIEAVREERVDLAVVDGRLLTPGGDKSEAALQALREAVRDYNEANLQDEADRDAAFPVRVDVLYVDRGAIDVPRLQPGGGGGTDGGSDDGATDGTGGNDSGGDGGGDGVGGNGSVGGGDGGGAAGDDAGSTGSPPLGGFTLVPEDSRSSTPSGMQPPFPFRSLILAYVFLIPMNFVVQVYAGRVMTERMDRRGEPLLASPATPREIIVGRTLPYLGLMLATTVAVTLWLGGGWLSVVAVMPLVLAFLAFEFVAAMFARSFRELTFLTVFISVVLTIYAFLPAVFTDVTPVAFISPITLVVVDLRGGAVTLAQGLYATLPMTLTAGVLFLLGAGLYREEDLFHQKRVPAKLVDAIARQVRGLWSGAKLSVFLIPLVLILELLVVTFLFAWPVSAGLIVGLLGVAVVEEAFKALPSWAGLSRGRIDPEQALLFGALTGLGFFVAEKLFLLASLVGLFEVASGQAVFGSAGRAAGVDPLTGVALLLAPLALHVTTATASAWGARRDRLTFVLAVGLAVAVHTLYNLVVIGVAGGGVP